MSKCTIVATITFSPKNEDIFNSALSDVKDGLIMILKEYQNYKFITDLTVEVKEQNGD